MNFHEGDPSSYYFYVSSLSFDDDEETGVMINNEFHLIDQQQMVFSQLISNAIAVSNYFQELDNLHRGGSIPGHVVINRDRSAAKLRLYIDYFSDSPMYNGSMFKRCFRMSRRLFLRSMESVQKHDNYFVQKVGALGRPRLSQYQKITVAVCILAYGVAANATDEYIKIGESTVIESVKIFCRAMVEVFGDWYFRSPNTENIERLLHIGKQRGFSGMLRSLDCMHWKRKNCPIAWAGQYAGHSGRPTIVLEAVADYDL